MNADSILFSIYVVLITLSTIWACGSLIAVWRVVQKKRQRSPRADDTLPPLSVLKPLCGADDDLEQNLRTFFEQDYPAFELIFGVVDPSDPAIPIVRSLGEQYPRVAWQLLVHNGGQALNQKVANLQQMLREVRHDLLLISDSNVVVCPTYLRSMVAQLEQSPNTKQSACKRGAKVKPVGLVTSLIAGHGERSVGAALESAQLCGAISGGVRGDGVCPARGDRVDRAAGAVGDRLHLLCVHGVFSRGVVGAGKVACFEGQNSVCRAG